MAHIQCSFFSPALQKNANAMVFIPTVSADDYLGDEPMPDYCAADKKYQTLYLLHGSYGDCNDWVHLASVERYAQEACLAVVMPSGENSDYVNMYKGEAYLTYITQELPSFFCKLFPLSRRREDTFIAGLSMGGYGAFHCAFACPEQYGAAAALSGALDLNALMQSTAPHVSKMAANYKRALFANGVIEGIDNDLPVLLKKQCEAGKEMPQLYMTCGTEDFIYPTNEAFYAAATALGANITYARHPGVHNWDFWDTHIQDVLKWLPLNGNLSRFN